MSNKDKDENDLADIENRVISHDGIIKDQSENAPQQPPKKKWWRCSCCEDQTEKTHAKPFVLEDVNASQKVLVLDLDETLVHCSFSPPEYYDVMISITHDAVQYDLYIQKRPFLDEFLKQIMPLFYVVIFTASLRSYANPVIDMILPELPPPQRLFRESCTYTNGMYIKDLDMFNMPLTKIIIVDNMPSAFGRHPENGILSATWKGARDDSELMDRILPILLRCVNASDVRNVIAESQPKSSLTSQQV